ncbi:MAG: S-methyl-5-thioribose-1-phosphate isomerase [Oscillospiraceae bacterium]
MEHILSQLDAVSFDFVTHELILLDQTRLPRERIFLRISDVDELCAAIRRLAVRGAPAIGVAAALGLWAATLRIPAHEPDSFVNCVKAQAHLLASARPTAVNLCWALNRMIDRMTAARMDGLDEMKCALAQEALAIWKEDAVVCRAIGTHGLSLLTNRMGILTHCNAGHLATSCYGTALAPIYMGLEQGISFHIYADETRPLLQGARLTCSELSAAGVDVTLLCDNMAATLMKAGKVNAVLVGCDRVARNGDTANKIGTLGIAVLARHFGIPFYVCAPLSTIDMRCPDGNHIIIEQRDPSEVTSLWYKFPMAPDDISVYNPAFDVTDQDLITAFVTEQGVIVPPFERKFEAILERKGEN